jgi:hypothetical protein
MARERLAIDRIIPKIATVCQMWQPNYVGIEAVAFQGFLLVEAKRRFDIPAVKPLTPSAGRLHPGIKMKLARATPAIIYASQGQIYLPENAPWLDDFILELVQFTGDPEQDAHDDQVDVLAYAIQEIDRGGWVKGSPPPENEKRSLQPVMTGSAQERRGLFGR